MWKKKTPLIILIGLAIIIKVFSLFPGAVENWYSKGIYPVISAGQRILFGWIPFSIGDFLYAALIIFLIYKVVDLVKRLVKKKTNRAYWINGLRQFVFAALLIYVSFNLLWGLNYNRRGIAPQLGLTVSRYSKEELVTVMGEVVQKLQVLDSSARLTRMDIRKKRKLFDGAVVSYDSLARTWPALEYSFSSVKPSLYSYLGNYLGFTGYYNPFSGEAQVNTTVPLFIQPFTTCHEIGHQLGYAKENEANFAGYLAARVSPDPAFRYSVYFDLYSYAWAYLYRQDSVQALLFNKQLPPGVKKDHAELRAFIRSHRNPVEAVIDHLYGEYLKANEQPSGKMAYNEVIAWLVAYYKKYGKDAI